MERLSDMVGGAGAWLSNISVVDGVGEGLWTRVDPRFPQLFHAYYAARNPLNNVPNPGDYMRGWLPRVLTDEDWISKDELRGTEFYNDFLEPLEATSVAMIRLAKDVRSAATSVINIGRPTSTGQFEQGELERLEAFHADLIRAYRLTVEFSRMRVFDLCRAHDGFSTTRAAMVVDDGGRILRCSLRAEALLREQHGVRSIAGRLGAADSSVSSRLGELIRRAGAAPPAPRLGGFMALPRADRVTPLVLSIAPLVQTGSNVFLPGRLSLVLITDPEDRPTPPDALLIDLFGLTQAEARVALALMAGGSLKDAASRLQISVNTATVHLARVFAKVGVNRQSELVALMSRIAQAPDPEAAAH